MITISESSFGKLAEKHGRALANSFLYLLSKNLKVTSDDDSVIQHQSLTTLAPSADLVARFVNGDINKKKFRKLYKKELKSDDNRFLIYTIVRSINEQHYMPFFIVNDDDYELGFLKVFADYIKDEFGLTTVKPKKYAAEVEQLWKDAKKEFSKKKKREKAFKKAVKSAVKDNVQVSFDGVKKLEKLDKEFSIHRIALLLNVSDDSDEVSKKTIITAIKAFADFNKKSAKLLKRTIDALDVSKKSDRWSRKDAVNIAMTIYKSITDTDDDE
jgi:uncharacterized protein YeaO (DUF488 family)